MGKLTNNVDRPIWVCTVKFAVKDSNGSALFAMKGSMSLHCLL